MGCHTAFDMSELKERFGMVRLGNANGSNLLQAFQTESFHIKLGGNETITCSWSCRETQSPSISKSHSDEDDKPIDSDGTMPEHSESMTSECRTTASPWLWS